MRWRLSLLVTLFLAAAAAGHSQALAPFTDGGIRIDLPANGQIRIENRFGDVRVEVTKQKEVVIAAAFSGGKPLKSPIVIEQKNELLLISVVHDEQGPRVGVNLTLRIPETARAEIVTNEGAITSSGLPASISLNTVSGIILVVLVPPLDADVIAGSIAGSVLSGLSADGATESHSFRSRFGAGTHIVRANSLRGDIFLAPSMATAETDRLPDSNGIPKLRGAPAPAPPAGTPSKVSGPEEVEEGDVIRVDTELVNMNFSVVDRGTNRGVAGLGQGDFKLFEDGAEQRILHFDSSAAPFDLMLVIDLSGSTREVVKLIRAAARRFVDAARPADRIAIVTFAAGPTIVAPLTLDRELLRQRVDAIDTLRGDTKLYDATDFALDELLKESRGARRTAIVLMSDGLDGSIPGVNSSNVTGAGSKLAYHELRNKLREFDGVVYTLWLNTYYEALNPQDTQPEAFDMGHDRMQELAEAGGGVFYEVEQLADLAGAYERVVTDLGTVYSLAYRPAVTNRDGKWRTIRVTVDRQNAIVRGKHGYYAN